MTNRHHREVRPEVEGLEDRQLLAVGTATLVGRTLRIDGTAEADNVRVVERGNRIRVILTDTATGQVVVQEFREGRVKGIEFRGGEGNDIFVNRADKRVIAFGDGGDDQIDVGEKRSIVTGGAGADTIRFEDDDTIVTDQGPTDILIEDGDEDED